MRLPAAGAPAIASLLGIALARVLLAEVMSAPAASLKLQFPVRGKPVCPGGADFSLSHSGTWLAGIACASARVGLDIEATAPASCSARGVRRALADWTAREATLKACGTSLNEVREVQVHEAHCLWQKERWWLARPQVPAGLVAALISERPLAVSVRSLAWESLVAQLIERPGQTACA
jgi:phosphopantetheinyl transferase